MKAKMAASPMDLPPSLTCAARRVSDETAETMFMVYLHKRGDRTTQSEREAASYDAVDSVALCGGNMNAFVSEMSRGGDEIPQTVVLALLEVGR